MFQLKLKTRFDFVVPVILSKYALSGGNLWVSAVFDSLHRSAAGAGGGGLDPSGEGVV